jgi:hypothetical protein
VEMTHRVIFLKPLSFSVSLCLCGEMNFA